MEVTFKWNQWETTALGTGVVGACIGHGVVAYRAICVEQIPGRVGVLCEFPCSLSEGSCRNRPISTLGDKTKPATHVNNTEIIIF